MGTLFGPKAGKECGQLDCGLNTLTDGHPLRT